MVKTFKSQETAYGRLGMLPKGSNSEVVIPYGDGYAIFDVVKGFYQEDRTWKGIQREDPEIIMEQARAMAAKQGHHLLNFRAFIIDSNRFHAECMNCGLYCTVDTTPLLENHSSPLRFPSPMFNQLCDRNQIKVQAKDADIIAATKKRESENVKIENARRDVVNQQRADLAINIREAKKELEASFGRFTFNPGAKNFDSHYNAMLVFQEANVKMNEFEEAQRNLV